MAGTMARSPLAQLLHALNQPLTGLQCSMEVALASPRTPEQYVHGLREGLELTERMRLLVEAIREVVDAGEEVGKDEKPDAAELQVLLREVAGDLEPVAEGKGVRIALDPFAGSLSPQTMGRQKLTSTIFRMLDSVLSLAVRGTELRIETGELWFRVRWHGGRAGSAFSRPELGLLVAQAGWERYGAVWERERMEECEKVTVRLLKISSNLRPGDLR
jgi:signal transduction histidine kinase